MVNKTLVVRNLWIVWSVLFVVVLVFTGVNLFGSDAVMAQLGQTLFDLSALTKAQDDQPPIILIVFGVMSFMMLALSVLFRKVIFSPKKIFASGSLDQASVQKWFSGQTISWAMAVAIGMFGLILGSNGQATTANFFFGAAILALIFLKPSATEAP